MSLLRSALLSPLCGLLLLGAPALLRADTAAVKWSDPTKPGQLRIYLGQGNVRIKGADTTDTVTASSSVKTAAPAKPRDDGLRVLGDTTGGFSLTEKANVAELTLAREGWGDGNADFTIDVPRQTALDIQLAWGGDVRVDDVAGDIAVKNMNGRIVLARVRGGVSVETMNGESDIAFAALPTNKPIAITSLNGNIKLSVPADAKAAVRFRTHHGAILTDFPESALPTKSEDQGGAAGWGAYAGTHAKVAVQIASEAAREIGRTAREIAAEVQAAVREQRRAEEEAAQSATPASREQTQPEVAAAAPVPPPAAVPAPVPAPRAPRAPRPPRPPSIPAIAGGKVVSGPLNGGGIDLQATTLHGDITLRRQE